MSFTPRTFQEAVDYLRRKQSFPTTLDTAGLRKLDADFRRQSFFSAQNFMESQLDEMKDAIGSILEPKQVKRADRITPENPEGWATEGFNPASARKEIRESLARWGYAPEPGTEGTIKDLSSIKRIDLVVDTNEKLAHGYGFKTQGESDTLLVTRPAWELYRQEDRVKKRDWIERFRMAGQLSGRDFGDGWIITDDEELIALKNHPLWDALGDSDNFDDALDVDYPPFAFNSGMWVREVDRDRCIELDILGADENAEPADKGFTVMEALA